VISTVVALPVPAVASQVQTLYSSVFSNPETVMLPYFVLRSLIRMTLAYILTLLFGVGCGVASGLSERVGKFLVPVLDVLQSVPVLGYLPAVLFFFISTMGEPVGAEIASILLIFTGMAWAVAFGAIGGVQMIPRDMLEVSNAFGARGWRFVRHILLPAIFPEIVSGSILAWGGGWYFLTACEYLTFGKPVRTLPGIGYYLFNSVVVGDTASAILGLAVLTGLVLIINRLVWHPLIDYSEKYRFETIAAPIVTKKRAAVPAVLRRYSKGTYELVSRAIQRERVYLSHLATSLHIRRLQLSTSRRFRRLRGRYHHLNYAISLVALAGALIALLAFAFRTPIPSISDIIQELMSHPEISRLPIYALKSTLRLGAGYAIALGWTLLAGLYVARSKKLSKVLIPIFDVAQSVPALALFPFMVQFIIDASGGQPWASEIASILLVITGMQWYLLFNIIGAIHAIPTDVVEAATAYGARGLAYSRHILLPAIFPGIVIGSIQAWGGGWNASIASEYITFGGRTYILEGLGSFLDLSSQIGDPTLVAISLISMTTVILILNRLIWRRLLKKTEKFRFEY
jgi:NitT/TauT family transport system permease protein